MNLTVLLQWVTIYLGQDNAMCLQAAEFNSKIGPFDLV